MNAIDQIAQKEIRNVHPIRCQQTPGTEAPGTEAPGTEAAGAEAARTQATGTHAARVLIDAAGIKGEQPVCAGGYHDAAGARAAKGRNPSGRGFDVRHDHQDTDTEDARSNEPVGIERFLGISDVLDLDPDADGQASHPRPWQAPNANSQAGRQRAGPPPRRCVIRSEEHRKPSCDE